MRRIFIPVFYAVVLWCIFALSSAQAQTTTEKVLIKGRVIDAKDKLPVIGATVIEQDNDKRTIVGQATDIDGNFALKISDVSHKLVISIIGYKSRIFDIGTRRVFNVTLEGSANDISEVQIVAHARTGNGTGLTIDKRDQTTSTVTLNAKDVEELQATTIDQAIQGRLPGVDIVSNSGDPGAGMSIKIRGTSSINGVSNPLIVVDGVPFDTQVPTDFNFATADNNQYADLLSIAPSDIQTISILKDAAATAVWGSRAANGVLIITTKRGVKGSPTISYTFKGTLTQQPSGIPLLTGDQYSTFIPEMVMNVTGAPLNTQTVREFSYDKSDPYYFYNYGQNTNWLKAISQTGYVMDHNLSITGGGDKARYFASVGYNDQKGTTIGTGLNRLNTRLNLDYIVSNKIHFTTFVAYAHTNTQYDYAFASNGSGFDGVRAIAATKMPNMSIYEYDQYGHLTPNFFSPASNIQGQYVVSTSTPSASYAGTYNPVAMATAALNNLIGDRITPHFQLVYNISGAWTATSDVVFDINNQRQAKFLPQIATGRPFTETAVNRASNSDFDTYSVSTKTNILFNPELGEKHSFTGLISLQSEDDKSYTQGQLISNTASSTSTDASVPGRTTNTDLSLTSGVAQTRTVAALINGQYKYLDRYIINVALREDGNSRFGESERYGFFPAVSARWRLSGEPFMKKYDKWLDEFSFRGSYGHSGNPPNKDYLFYSVYTNTPNNYLGLSGLYPNSIQLNNLRWEDLVGIDAGVNIIMFKNRLNIDLDLYRNRTNNLLTPNLSLATYTGYSSVALNVGTLDNQGFELSIFSTPYKSRKLQVDFNFNISQNLNTLRSISPYYATSSGDVTTNGHYLSVLQLNNPLGSFYGYKFKGVYTNADATIARDANGGKIVSPDGTPVQMRFNYPKVDYKFQPGDAIYEDINHDGNINYQDVVYLGNGNPKFTGGFGPTVTWGGRITLQAFFNYRLGGQIINGTKMQTTNEYSYDNQSSAVLRRWRTPGDNTDIPRALFNYGYNWLGSDRYVESGTFLRFRSITARYNFDKALASRIKAKNLSVYLTAENLLTFTHYTGQDPEVSTSGVGIFSQVVDNSTTPPLKQVTFGLSASF
ncbi:SusC/RagA family TonB-linked outer membrane protein [Mucilaginibacter boryungensis]|uniref:SusC/RagA family TonB-linked outer membrane protein n=1 Tax=Mucilaginibacter boryungensis TaxID=768480 RepID=A0ABR9XGL2_9SPHI|nr:SusC/RagA family TonB-linked outer membrane protein [Mucilaginibacter boryungensis]MBE9666371.1 SusC/RagA family TonB-linked outer membrane protein [Mucilaginibacter boryungensis]